MVGVAAPSTAAAAPATATAGAPRTAAGRTARSSVPAGLSADPQSAGVSLLAPDAPAQPAASPRPPRPAATPETPLAEPVVQAPTEPTEPAASRPRRAARRRLATERLFNELASLAAIPVDSYAVGEEVEGALCLLETEEGFEVFHSSGGNRHELQFFTTEESACFYLFGVLVAEAVRNGSLAPSSVQSPFARPQR
jgi:hypothetical protein